MELPWTDTLVSRHVNLRQPSQNLFELPYKLSAYSFLQATADTLRPCDLEFAFVFKLSKGIGPDYERYS